MTKSQYLAAVDSVVTDQVVEGGITPTSLGTLLAELGSSVSFEDETKVYVAMVTQAGSNDPSVTVIKNTLVGTPVWTRFAAGIYFCTLAGAFTPDKVFLSITTANDETILSINSDEDIVTVVTRDASSNTIVDGHLTSSRIKIEVYP